MASARPTQTNPNDLCIEINFIWEYPWDSYEPTVHRTGEWVWYFIIGALVSH